MRTLLIALAAALALPAAAAAGGWATAGLAPPPGDLGPGDTWRAELQLLQHGVTPLEGVHPSVTIVAGDGTRTTFPAEPTAEAGVYVAAVTMPAVAGTHRYEVDDGFSRVHTFAPFELAAGAAGGFSGWGIASLVAGGSLLGGLVALARLRRARPRTGGVPALD